MAAGTSLPRPKDTTMHSPSRTFTGFGFLVGLLALSVIGCGGDDAGTGAPGQHATGASGGVSGAGSFGGQGAASGFGGQSGSAPCADTDAPDADGTDDNCDGADGVVGTDVHVASTGADTNPGTPDAPMRTIPKALELAHVRSAKVLLGGGEFEVTSLSQAGDIEIHGGYAEAFSGKRQASSSTLKASSPEGVVVSEASSVLLDTLSIVGVPAKEASQRSSQALVLDVGSSRLFNVHVEAGAGLSGGAGEDGAAGTSGKDGNGPYGATQLSCDGSIQPSFAFGANAGSKNSAGAVAGNCGSKIAASAGAPGISGGDGANASSLASFENGVLRWSDAADAPDDAKPGFGGAGGGSCAPANLAAGAGSGGCPGSPGTGGESGGGAIGIVVLQGKLVLEASNIRTGFGGDGGNGGKGGAGGPGGKSGKPACPYGFDCTQITQTCTPATDPWKSNCAPWGGVGGPGGDGGHGGGGVGGWSVGIVTIGAATSEYDSATTFDLGAPGKGGDGAGGIRAANGEKRKQWALP